MAQAVRQGGGGHGSEAIGAVPGGDAEGLLGAAEPLGGDDAEEREAAALEEAEEEAGGEQAAVAVAGGHGALGDAPAEAQARHQDPVRHAHDQVRRQRLHGQLRDGRDRPHQRVLVARQARGLLEAERRSVAEHRLVQDLQEVHPHQDRQDHLVRLPPDPLVLWKPASVTVAGDFVVSAGLGS